MYMRRTSRYGSSPFFFSIHVHYAIYYSLSNSHSPQQIFHLTLLLVISAFSYAPGFNINNPFIYYHVLFIMSDCVNLLFPTPFQMSYASIMEAYQYPQLNRKNRARDNNYFLKGGTIQEINPISDKRIRAWTKVIKWLENLVHTWTCYERCG